jgi:hypothetical protein
MVENDGATVGRIRSYLAEHGGSVQDPGGRLLTDEMARAIGLERPAALSALLGQMEQDGLITRDMRGLRTFRIALTEAEPAAAPVEAAAPVQVAAAPAPVEAATAELPAASSGSAPGAVSLRDAISRHTVAAGAGAGPGPAPPAEAATSNGAHPAATAEPVPAATNLRQRLVGAGVTPAPGWADASPPVRPADRFSRPREFPASPPAGDPPPPAAHDEHTSETPSAPPAPPAEARAASRLTTAPMVKAPPSTTMVAAVSAAMAGLVLIAVILVVVARGSNHRVVQTDTPPSSTDACNVVTTDMATAVFGQPAGAPHFVLGECVYDDGTHELIAEVYRQNARMLFDAGHSASAQDVPSIGDGAYYVDGKLRVIKGAALLEIALGPTPAATPSAKLLTLAGTAAGRL